MASLSLVASNISTGTSHRMTLKLILALSRYDITINASGTGMPSFYEKNTLRSQGWKYSAKYRKKEHEFFQILE
jgi:hypothetical protein